MRELVATRQYDRSKHRVAESCLYSIQEETEAAGLAGWVHAEPDRKDANQDEGVQHGDGPTRSIGTNETAEAAAQAQTRLQTGPCDKGLPRSRREQQKWRIQDPRQQSDGRDAIDQAARGVLLVNKKAADQRISPAVYDAK